MNRKDANTARRLGPSAWRDDWMPATKETLMPAEPVDASDRTRADRAEDLTHADSVRRLGPQAVIGLDQLAKLAEQAIADHSVCVNEGCPDERIIPPSLRWFVEDYIPAVLTDGSPAARASQAATDEPELTAADRAILAAQNGERCIHVDPDRGRQCALTAGHDTHIADGGGWTLLPGEDDVLPARASQAATATHSTGDDVGAAHDPHKPAAANSGAHIPEEIHGVIAQSIARWARMYPIPANSLASGEGAWKLAHNWGDIAARHLLEDPAVIPAIRAAVLDQARTELTTTRDGITWDDDIADSARAAYSDAINRLDAIARGDQ